MNKFLIHLREIRGSDFLSHEAMYSNILIYITREQRVKARRNNKELLKEELEFLKRYLNISRVRTSQVAESK